MNITKRFLLISLFILGIMYTGCEEKNLVDRAMSGVNQSRDKKDDGDKKGDEEAGSQGSGGSSISVNKVDDDGLHVMNFNIPVSDPDGSSWDKAFNDLQRAIEKAKGGKKKVYVAKGTYKPTSRPNIKGSSDPRTLHFSLRNGVEVIGGYSGKGNENDPKVYKTILSGDIKGDDTDDIKVNRGDNVYHVFYHPSNTNLDNTAKLTKVTITKGNANGSDDNSRGGGMYNVNSSPTLTNCTFTDNTATKKGGAVYSDKDSNPNIDDDTRKSFIKIGSNNPNGSNNDDFKEPSRDKKDDGDKKGDEEAGSQGSGGSSISVNKVDDGGLHVRISDESVSNPDGLSWDKAFNDLQEAIKKAKETGKSKVYIAQGIYKPTGHPNGGRGDRKKHFSLRNGVEVIGGYSGNRDENDPTVYKTILSGDIGTPGDADNVYHVFYHPEGISLNNAARLTKVTVTKGNANGSDTNSRGGGMFNENSGPTLTKVIFTSNRAVSGGGMYNKESSPTLTDCTFTDNTATKKGGAVYSDKDSNPNIDDDTRKSFIKIGSNNPNGSNNDDFKESSRDKKDDGDKKGDEEAGSQGSGEQDGTPGPGTGGSSISVNKVDDGGLHVRISDESVSNPDGSSWDKAFNDLQEAIKKAKETGKSKVYIAQGTYKPTDHPNGGQGDREKHFSLRNGVEVIGGYSGNGDENDPKAYKTILSGDIGKPGDADNVYHVFYHPEGISLNNAAKLTKVTVTKGNANGSDTNSRGGGMFNENSGPTLTKVIFTSNRAVSGGGMYNKESSPRLVSCEFNDNTAKTKGGGMYNWESSTTLIDCYFNNNSAKDVGGGIYTFNSSLTLIRCYFNGNFAKNTGGGIYNAGLTSSSGSAPTLTGCHFNNNTANSGGGMINYDSSPTLRTCQFNKNRATYYGGGMYNRKSAPKLTNCKFTNNEAELGGGMINYDSSPTLTNCTFTGNTAKQKGGAVYGDKGSNPNIDDDTKKSFTRSNDPDGKNNGNVKGD